MAETLESLARNVRKAQLGDRSRKRDLSTIFVRAKTDGDAGDAAAGRLHPLGVHAQSRQLLPTQLPEGVVAHLAHERYWVPELAHAASEDRRRAAQHDLEAAGLQLLAELRRLREPGRDDVDVELADHQHRLVLGRHQAPRVRWEGPKAS